MLQAFCNAFARRASLVRTLCFAALVASGPLAQAERPSAPRLLPENTLFYARVDDARDLVEKFQETQLGQLTQDEQIQPLIGNLYSSASQAFLQLQDEVGLSLNEILQLPQGELCLAVVAPKTGPPAVVGLFDCGDEIPAAMILVDRALTEMRQDGWNESRETVGDTELTVMSRGERRQAIVFEKENTLVFSSNMELARQLIQIWDGVAEEDVKTLADNRRFTTIMKNSAGTKGEPPQISWFADPVKFFSTATRGSVGAQAGLALLGPLGLNGFNGVGGSIVLAPDEFDSIMHFHVLLGTPRVGVLNLLALESGDLTPEPWVPGDVASYMTIHWDLMQTYKEAGDIIDVVRGEGQFKQMVQQRLGDQLGINFEKDVLEALGGRYTMCTRIERPITLNSETTMIAVQLENPTASKATIEKILGQMPEQPGRASYGGINYWVMSDAQRERVATRQQNSPVPIRTPDFAVGIVGDYLLMTDSRKFFEKAVATKQGGSPPLAEQLEYKLIAGEVERQAGGKKPAGFILGRPEESLRGFYEFAQQGSTRAALSDQAQNNGFFRALNEALEEHPLPPFEVVAEYLTPQGGLIYDDETGIHYTAFSLRRD